MARRRRTRYVMEGTPPIVLADLEHGWTAASRMLGETGVERLALFTYNKRETWRRLRGDILAQWLEEL